MTKKPVIKTQDLRLQQPVVLTLCFVSLAVFTESSTMLLRSFASSNPLAWDILMMFIPMYFSGAHHAWRQSRKRTWGEIKMRKVLRIWICHSCMLAAPQPINPVFPCLYKKNYFSLLRIWIVPQRSVRLCCGQTKSVWFCLEFQVKWLHLVESLHKNKEGEWISGCISAFFSSPAPLNNKKSFTRKARVRKPRVNLRKS